MAIIARRSGRRTPRFSLLTLKKLGGRRHLRRAFIDQVEEGLVELGYSMVELAGSGYVLLDLASLEAASRTVTAKRWLNEDEMNCINQGVSLDLDALLSELEQEDKIIQDEFEE